jgi:hypothetical protein
VLVLSYLIAGEARGLGELRPLPGCWPRAAEAAISVERALLRRLTLVAQPLDSPPAPALPARQRPDGRLARQQDSRLRFAEGQVAASIELPLPTGCTVLEKVLGEPASPRLERFSTARNRFGIHNVGLL